jgi:hypothetical protein
MGSSTVCNLRAYNIMEFTIGAHVFAVASASSAFNSSWSSSSPVSFLARTCATGDKDGGDGWREKNTAHDEFSEILHSLVVSALGILDHFVRLFQHSFLFAMVKLANQEPRQQCAARTPLLMSHDSAPSAMNLSTFTCCCSASLMYNRRSFARLARARDDR